MIICRSFLDYSRLSLAVVEIRYGAIGNLRQTIKQLFMKSSVSFEHQIKRQFMSLALVD